MTPEINSLQRWENENEVKRNRKLGMEKIDTNFK